MIDIEAAGGKTTRRAFSRNHSLVIVKVERPQSFA